MLLTRPSFSVGTSSWRTVTQTRPKTLVPIPDTTPGEYMRYAGCHLARHEVDREWPKSLQASLHFKFLLHPARQFHDGRDILGSGAPQRERRAAHSLRARGSVSPFPSRYRSSTRCACRCASASAICSPINSSVSHASTPCWTIVGASVAYHLARQGVSVTLIDRASSPAAGSDRRFLCVDRQLWR